MIPIIQEPYTVTVKQHLGTFQTALQMFFAEHKRYPAEKEGLEAIRDLLLQGKVPNDPMGNPYIYHIPGPDDLDYLVICTGSDGIEGTEDDCSTVNIENCHIKKAFQFNLLLLHLLFLPPFSIISILLCFSLFILVTSTIVYFSYKGYLHIRKKKQGKM
jgi:hypothetical protein